MHKCLPSDLISKNQAFITFFNQLLKNIINIALLLILLINNIRVNDFFK